MPTAGVEDSRTLCGVGRGVLRGTVACNTVAQHDAPADSACQQSRRPRMYDTAWP